MKTRPAKVMGSAEAKWPAADVQMVSIDILAPYAKNARTHSDAQIAQIAASIREFGFTIPVLVDERNVIIAGHGRVLAAKQIGLARVPVMVARGWSDAQRRAYVLADNQIALNAGWDDALLRVELGDLRSIGFDIGLVGFGADDMDRLFPGDQAAEDERADEDAPEPPARPTTRRGDIWVLGQHRIICGDATLESDVIHLLGGAKPNLMVTDPPYGVNYDPAWRNRAGVSATRRTGTVENDHRADWREAWALFPGSTAYVWHSAVFGATVAESLIASRFAIRAQVIWAKKSMVFGRGDYHWQHEPCIYAVRQGGKSGWQGKRDQTTLWAIATRSGDTEDPKTIHSTQKPLECMRRPILNNSKSGDEIYEPFSGSGTTIIAAEVTERRCFAVEIDPSYVDVAVMRWQAFAGKTATLEATSETFDAVKAQRTEETTE